MSEYASETQLSMWPVPDEVHELVRVSHVGTLWRATCSCGMQTSVAGARAEAVGRHRAHREWARTPLDDRRPRP